MQDPNVTISISAVFIPGPGPIVLPHNPHSIISNFDAWFEAAQDRAWLQVSPMRYAEWLAKTAREFYEGVRRPHYNRKN
jgi:hypothetical protein